MTENQNVDQNVTGETRPEELTGPQRTESQGLGEDLRRMAADAAYAATGFAGFIGEKAKAFYDEQRREYSLTHPEADKDPGAKEFLNQLNERLNALVEDISRGFRDMSDRGRASFTKSGNVAPGDVTVTEPADVTVEETQPEFVEDAPAADDVNRPFTDQDKI